MNERSIPIIQRPEMDYQPVFDIVSALFAYPAVLVSHDLKLFSLLAESPRTLPEICDARGIASRAARALLAANVGLGLVRLEGDRYALTPLAENYLVETSPVSFCGYLDLAIANYSAHSVESLKKAVLTNSPQAYGGEDYVESHKRQSALAHTFTLAMHSVSMGPALAWPEALDLSEHRIMLDIGGGSGAHSIGAMQRWPNLQAIVLDLPPVCQVAEEVIQRHGMQERIKTRICDFWTDAFPPADLHLHSGSYEGWPPEKCRFLTQKSFESLTPGGRIIIHEILFNDDKAGPLAAVAFNIVMLEWTPGQVYSGQELSAMLMEAGFTDIEVKPTFGCWGIVTGHKP